jgi:DNA invertase Pin-like site-specific DNA recombinase
LVRRPARPLAQLATLGELHAKGVDLYLHRQGIDTTTPAGKAMFQMMGVFAEFERSMIVERVKAGIARARVTGTKSGKPIGRAPTSPKVEAAIRKTLAKGTGIIKTAKLHKVGVSVVQRIKAAA